MDKLLAIQVTEALFLEQILSDSNGLRTLLRVKNQSKTVDERIKAFYRTIEPIWQAIKQPGAFSLKKVESMKWESDVRNAIITAIFGAIETVGINEIIPKGNCFDNIGDNHHFSHQYDTLTKIIFYGHSSHLTYTSS